MAGTQGSPFPNQPFFHYPLYLRSFFPTLGSRKALSFLFCIPCHLLPNTSLQFLSQLPRSTSRLRSALTLGQTQPGPLLPRSGPRGSGGLPLGSSRLGLCTTMPHLFLPHSPPLPIIPTQALIFTNDTIWWFGVSVGEFLWSSEHWDLFALVSEEGLWTLCRPRQAVVMSRGCLSCKV